MRFTILALLVCITCKGFTQADTSFPAEVKNLGEVVFTAERKNNFRFHTPYSIEIIRRKELIDLNPRTTPEALQVINGVFVQKTNHGGGSAFVRGLTGNQILTLVDGIRLNNSTFRFGPNQYLNTIDVFSTDRIEVAKGTGSVQYGSDALGGVIQVFSREPDFTEAGDKWKANLTGRYMSHEMDKTIRAEGSYHSKNFAVFGGITSRNFGDVWGGDTTGVQIPSGYDEMAFDLKAKIRAGDKWQLTLAHQFVQQNDVPVYHRVKLEDYFVNEMDPQQRMLNYARLNLFPGSAWINQLEFTVSWQQSLEVRNSQKNGTTVLRKEEDRVNTIGITADMTSLINKNWSANSGIELYTDKVNSSREDINTLTSAFVAKRGLYPDDSKYGNYSIYSLHHLNYGRWRFDIGARYNFFNIQIKDSALGDVSLTPSCLVGNAGILFNLSSKQNLFFNYSTGYRAPNVDDMGTLGIVDFRYEVPAHDLLPERSGNFELGYKFSSGKFLASASIFYMKLENLVTRIKVDSQEISGYPVYKKENVESAFINGAEAEIRWMITSSFSLGSSIAYAYGQNETKNEPLRRIPPLNGRSYFSYRKGKLFLQTEFMFASKQDRLAQGDKDDNRIPKGGTPGWQVLNLYGGYELKFVRFNLGLQNIFNEDYRTHGSGINGYGRSFWISVSLSI